MPTQASRTSFPSSRLVILVSPTLGFIDTIIQDISMLVFPFPAEISAREESALTARAPRMLAALRVRGRRDSGEAAYDRFGASAKGRKIWTQVKFTHNRKNKK
jgi:hypothetical protein